MADEIRPECKVLFDAIAADIAEIKIDTKATRVAVIGNGNPEKSLATRVARNETLWKVFGIIAAVIGACAALAGAAYALNRLTQ